jgi:hypothetical protein
MRFCVRFSAPCTDLSDISFKAQLQCLYPQLSSLSRRGRHIAKRRASRASPQGHSTVGRTASSSAAAFIALILHLKLGGIPETYSGNNLVGDVQEILDDDSPGETDLKDILNPLLTSISELKRRGSLCF